MVKMNMVKMNMIYKFMDSPHTPSPSTTPSTSPSIQFNDLPNELVYLIMEYGLHVFDRRSRILVQKRISDLLVIHEHTPLVTRRLMEKLIWRYDIFWQYYTLQHELRQSLSPEQLREISNS